MIAQEAPHPKGLSENEKIKMAIELTTEEMKRIEEIKQKDQVQKEIAKAQKKQKQKLDTSFTTMINSADSIITVLYNKIESEIKKLKVVDLIDYIIFVIGFAKSDLRKGGRNLLKKELHDLVKKKLNV